MHWQHGQMVQGTPRIQNYQSTTSGAPEAGLQTLSRRCARYAWLPTTQLRGHISLSEPRSAGHSCCLQTTKGTGLRRSVRGRRKYFVWNLPECRGVSGHKVCVTKAPAHKGGNNRKKQLCSGQRHSSSPSCCSRER